MLLLITVRDCYFVSVFVFVCVKKTGTCSCPQTKARSSGSRREVDLHSQSIFGNFLLIHSSEMASRSIFFFFLSVFLYLHSVRSNMASKVFACLKTHLKSIANLVQNEWTCECCEAKNSASSQQCTVCLVAKPKAKVKLLRRVVVTFLQCYSRCIRLETFPVHRPLTLVQLKRLLSASVALLMAKIYLP